MNEKFLVNVAIALTIFAIGFIVGYDVGNLFGSPFIVNVKCKKCGEEKEEKHDHE